MDLLILMDVVDAVLYQYCPTHVYTQQQTLVVCEPCWVVVAMTHVKKIQNFINPLADIVATFFIN